LILFAKDVIVDFPFLKSTFLALGLILVHLSAGAYFAFKKREVLVKQLNNNGSIEGLSTLAQSFFFS